MMGVESRNRDYPSEDRFLVKGNMVLVMSGLASTHTRCTQAPYKKSNIRIESIGESQGGP